MSETVVSIGDFVRFLDSAGGCIPLRNYQNFFVGKARSWAGQSYIFAPFILDGDTSTRAGETPQATLGSVGNPLTIALFTEAATNRYLVEIEKVSIQLNAGDPPTFTEQLSLGKYLWSVTGYEAAPDGETVAINLNGPRNAVDRQVPRGRLTSELVGAMPATGSIFTS